MSIYFVDYENVGSAGLMGINRLAEGDLVIVFHGLNSGSISFDLHVQIFSSQATIEYIRTGKTGKNYLDFQLTTYLGYQVANSIASEFIVVSRDAGFDAVIDFWRARAGRRTFRRQTSISAPPVSTANVVKPAFQTAPAAQPALQAAKTAPVVAQAAPAVVEAAKVAPAVAQAAPVVAETAKAATPTVTEVIPEAETEVAAAVEAQPAIVEAAEEAPKKKHAGGRPRKKPVEETVAKAAPRNKGGRPRKVAAEQPSSAEVAEIAVAEATETVAAPAAAPKTAERKKLPTEVKKQLVDNLKGYKLNVRSYSTIHSLMMKNANENDFKGALAKAFPGRDEEIYGLIGGTYKSFTENAE